MRLLLIIFWISMLLASCKTSEEKAVAELEKSLGLGIDPYFPKCLNEEVTPRAALGAGDYNIGNTIGNPQGDVPIDRCARWETDEPTGNKNESQKLDFRYPDKSKSEDSEDTEPDAP